MCGGSDNVDALPPGLDAPEVVPGFGNGAAGGPVDVGEPPFGPPANVGPAVDVGGDEPPPIARGHARQIASAIRDDVPVGCSLHRYDGGGQKNPYWFAVLPAGVFDDQGRKARGRTFAPHLRSEDVAVSDCHAWLWSFGEI